MSFELSPWDKIIPYKNEKTGYETTLYNSAVAGRMIGRSTQTMTKWEIAGTIPITPFRVNGKRMYCEEQINILIECAENARISQGRKIAQTNFSSQVQKKWNELFREIFEVSEDE